MQTVDHVDLDKFMGEWHVLADVATPFDKGATDPLEIYRRNADGTIATTYQFVRDGETRTMRARGFVENKQTNAEWGMQFVWPIRADYRVVYLDPEYQYTIIGRNRRDYVWIMSREPHIPVDTFEDLIAFTESLGYQRQDLRLHHPLSIEPGAIAQ